ncbi:multiprotein-bridging factor 1 family protein [Streptomyces sp. NPDC056161]|uniref:helix-turn-helix domain-containing protein n=1 Tax=Streptomyces sp. NPDC056161 TaxID=3345732 RepID=UPI0035D6E64E
MNDPRKRKRQRRPRGAPLDHAPEGITYAREQTGMTKRALAEALRISEQLLCDIEAGRRNAGPELLERMAKRLDCPLVVLQAKYVPHIPETSGVSAAQRPENSAPLGP